MRELRAISDSDRKSDQVDAEKLARWIAVLSVVPLFGTPPTLPKSP
jgi:hypothetical protein